MKGKHLALLLILVALVGGAGYILFKKEGASWSDASAGSGKKVLDLPITKINETARVIVKSPSDELNLVKKDDVWTVQERA
jgi:hypothetical protein